jgi:nucleoside-diphosphate-sugar epimerase
MRLLLTGGTGFVGRNFLLRALELGVYDEILLPVRSPDKLRQQFIGDGFKDIPAQIKPIPAQAPEWKLGELPPVDHVVHLVGIMFARSREEYFATNVEGTLNLLRALAPSGGETPRVLILSSQSAAGPCRHGEPAKEETHGDKPVTWYGESKLELERRVAAEFSHLNYLFLRPPMILGPRDRATLPLFKMARQPVQFKPGRRSKWYSFISAGDLVSAILAALQSPRSWRELERRSYFVTSPEPISDTAMILEARRSLNRRGILLRVPQPLLRVVSQVVDRVPVFRNAVPLLTRDRAREIWPDRWVVSSAKFQQSFGWHPKADLTSTINETRDWYVKSGEL